MRRKVNSALFALAVLGSTLPALAQVNAAESIEVPAALVRGLDYCPGDEPSPTCEAPGCFCTEAIGQHCPGVQCHLCLISTTHCSPPPAVERNPAELSCPAAGDPYLCWREFVIGSNDDLGEVGHLLEDNCWDARFAVPVSRDGAAKIAARWIDGCDPTP